jgi:hypothetical protein
MLFSCHERPVCALTWISHPMATISPRQLCACAPPYCLRQLVGAVTPNPTGTGPGESLQQVTWIKPILCALDRLNVRIASGVGCKITLQRFFSK